MLQIFDNQTLITWELTENCDKGFRELVKKLLCILLAKGGSKFGGC